VAGLGLYGAVGVGSALGALARYLCTLAMVALLGPAFPWGTLAVNVLGSFLIGLYATVTEPDGRLRASPAQRQFVIAGFCGGFTTFSIFSLETLLLVERQAFGLAADHANPNIVPSFCPCWMRFHKGVRWRKTHRFRIEITRRSCTSSKPTELSCTAWS
jgi:fluoride exporter